MFIGNKQINGGRAGDEASYGLTEQLVEHGLVASRMKTGTPPRVDGRSIDFSLLEEQKIEKSFNKFSFDPISKQLLPNKACFLAYTNKQVHDELKLGFETSPLLSGLISGVGPRYCPSIEDKLVTFSDKNKHLLFIEPEGIDTNEYYLNGFSSSLSLSVQLNAIRKIRGLENAEIIQPAYAIEYDYFDPTQLSHSLESKKIDSLFFAGQVNGTTGYEEAAAQGLVAGINSFLKLNNKKPLQLYRHSSYISVLIDDLVTRGIDEPYRLFTSRAEHRILLRYDNADKRLSSIGYSLGLISKRRFHLYKNKYSAILGLINLLKAVFIYPKLANPFLTNIQSSVLNQKVKAAVLLLRPEVSIFLISKISTLILEYLIVNNFSNEMTINAQTTIKYDFYIKREKETLLNIKKSEHIKIPNNIDYNKIPSVSIEAKQQLFLYKPKSIREATKIKGVKPSDIVSVFSFLTKKNNMFYVEHF